MLAKFTLSKNSYRPRATNWNELWSEVKTGDRDSLSTLFCSSYSQLYSYGYSIVRDEALVKDCIQELFLNLWRKRNNIADAKSVKSYLICSLRRIIFRRLKRQRNRARRNYEYSESNFGDLFNTEELIIYFENEQHKKQQLMEALRSLNNRQKEAVYLKFYSGLSNDEISEVMKVNKQSVYNHISKAIKKMQHFVS